MLAVCAMALRAGAATAEEAKRLLYAAKYDEAAASYRQLLLADPGWAAGYGYLIRALLGAKKTPEAYAALDEALHRAPDAAEVQTALGEVMFRRGEFERAAQALNAAIQKDQHAAEAAAGLEQLFECSSQFHAAAVSAGIAHRLSPDDPVLLERWANTLDNSPDHIAALERALAIFDPGTEEARSLRVHIAADRALAGRSARVLQSGYRRYELKLSPLYVTSYKNSSVLRGFGVEARLNGKPVNLLLDTGAGGILVSRRIAEKAALENLSGKAAGDLKGIGDAAPPREFRYLAEELRIGDLVFASYPVSVTDSKQMDDFDGLIGADVFEQFLVTLDFPKSRITLEPYSGMDTPPVRRSEDAGPVPPGFTRFYRRGHLLLLPVRVNQHPPKWFIVDSGAGNNLIDAQFSREVTNSRPVLAGLGGVQGRVNKVFQADQVELVFAGLRQKNIGMTSFEMRKMSDDTGVEISGILGMQVLRELKVTLDYRNGAILLSYKNR